MSLEKEKLQFEWQSATNNFMIILSLLIAIISLFFVIPQYKKFFFYVFVFIITWLGISVIMMAMTEYNYGHYSLRDKRKKEMNAKARIIKAVYTSRIIIGIVIILIAIGILSFQLTSP